MTRWSMLRSEAADLLAQVRDGVALRVMRRLEETGANRPPVIDAIDERASELAERGDE